MEILLTNLTVNHLNEYEQILALYNSDEPCQLLWRSERMPPFTSNLLETKITKKLYIKLNSNSESELQSVIDKIKEIDPLYLHRIQIKL